MTKPTYISEKEFNSMVETFINRMRLTAQDVEDTEAGIYTEQEKAEETACAIIDNRLEWESGIGYGAARDLKERILVFAAKKIMNV